jgi:hypothetical protein
MDVDTRNMSIGEKTLAWALEWAGKGLIAVCLYFISEINGTLKEISKTQQAQTRILDIQEIRVKTMEDRFERKDQDDKEKFKDLYKKFDSKWQKINVNEND